MTIVASQPLPGSDGVLSATLACIRLLRLHEEVEIEYAAFVRMERRLDAALRELDVNRVETLETAAREGRVRVGKLLRALAFAVSEYRVLDYALLEANGLGNTYAPAYDSGS